MNPQPPAGYAVDASALLALLLQEPGHDAVEAVLGGAFIHCVNVAEAIGKLVRSGVPRPEAESAIQDLGIPLAGQFPAVQAGLCGELLANTRRLGLSLGDCVCLTSAAMAGAVALTADRAWQSLEGTLIGSAEIRVATIR